MSILKRKTINGTFKKIAKQIPGESPLKLLKMSVAPKLLEGISEKDFFALRKSVYRMRKVERKKARAMMRLKLEQENKNNYEINVQCQEIGKNFERSSFLEGTKK